VSEERSIDETPLKEGIYERDGILYVIGPRYVARVARALASESRTELLYHLKDGPKSLEELSSVLGQSKANVSNHVRKLEALDIVTASYSPSVRGVKKSIALKVRAIVLVLYEEAVKDIKV
jgi:DNA-binding transcriptional ArsR family regulator